MFLTLLVVTLSLSITVSYTAVRLYELERYITPQQIDIGILTLSGERWILEIYRTLIASLQSIAWMYLLVFIVALIAYVLVRGFALKRGVAAVTKETFKNE